MANEMALNFERIMIINGSQCLEYQLSEGGSSSGCSRGNTGIPSRKVRFGLKNDNGPYSLMPFSVRSIFGRLVDVSVVCVGISQGTKRMN